MIRLCSFLAVTALAGTIAGCSSKDPAPAATSCEELTKYSKPGPYVAGVTTIDIDGVTTEVWYPADKGSEAGKAKDKYDMRTWLPAADRGKISDDKAPLWETDAYRDLAAAKGSFPVVLFSHGLGGYRLQSSFLMSHLATWGFVVAAPDHVGRGLARVIEFTADPDNPDKALDDDSPKDLRGALGRLRQENGQGGRFEGRLVLSNVGIVGHSQGGAAIAAVLGDADFKVGIFLASPGFGDTARKQQMMLWGSADRVALPSSIQQAFETRPKGSVSVGIRNAGHMAFTDLCLVGAERGGVLKIAEDSGITVADLLKTLGSDGCGAQPDGSPYLDIRAGWSVINQYTTQQLLNAIGTGERPTLAPTSASCFGELVSKFATQEQEPQL
jgi:alpha-beta hydrolase superfamily lysophospholipase